MVWESFPVFRRVRVILSDAAHQRLGKRRHGADALDQRLGVDENLRERPPVIKKIG